jgi:hypothetical protein
MCVQKARDLHPQLCRIVRPLCSSVLKDSTLYTRGQSAPDANHCRTEALKDVALTFA